MFTTFQPIENAIKLIPFCVDDGYDLVVAGRSHLVQIWNGGSKLLADTPTDTSRYPNEVILCYFFLYQANLTCSDSGPGCILWLPASVSYVGFTFDKFWFVNAMFPMGAYGKRSKLFHTDQHSILERIGDDPPLVMACVATGILSGTYSHNTHMFIIQCSIHDCHISII